MIRSVCLYRDELARIDDLTRLVVRVFLSGVRLRPAPVERRRAVAGKR